MIDLHLYLRWVCCFCCRTADDAGGDRRELRGCARPQDAAGEGADRRLPGALLLSLHARHAAQEAPQDVRQPAAQGQLSVTSLLKVSSSQSSQLRLLFN